MTMVRIRHHFVSLACYFLFFSAALSQEDDSCSSGGRNLEENVHCTDSHRDCAEWAEDGECKTNPVYMLRSCHESCDACGPCEDEEELCWEWAEDGECETNPQFMLTGCRKSCDNCEAEGEDYGIDQLVEEGEHADDVEQAIDDMKEYFRKLREDSETSDEMHDLLDNCRNNDERCAFWSVTTNECEKGTTQLKMDCAAACQNCEILSFEHRCPFDPDAPDAWGKGDLDQFFFNITTLPEYKVYDAHILSRPEYAKGDTSETADYQIGPWVVTLDHFLTNEEADRLVELGAEEGYERSSDVGEQNFDGTFENTINNDRTSINSWCQTMCYEDPIAKQVMDKLATTTNIPEENSEYIQLLKYSEGQYYRTHHDYIEFDLDRQPGVRILTIFLYLNDVEAGGGTNFPELDLTVMPKKGRALIWPSVLDEDPHERDDRTFHQAMEVEKGVKYGANAWLHMRGYKEHHNLLCV